MIRQCVRYFFALPPAAFESQPSHEGSESKKTCMSSCYPQVSSQHNWQHDAVVRVGSRPVLPGVPFPPAPLAPTRTHAALPVPSTQRPAREHKLQPFPDFRRKILTGASLLGVTVSACLGCGKLSNNLQCPSRVSYREVCWAEITQYVQSAWSHLFTHVPSSVSIRSPCDQGLNGFVTGSIEEQEKWLPCLHEHVSPGDPLVALQRHLLEVSLREPSKK